MEAGQATTWLCPAAQIILVGEDGIAGAPEVVLVPEAIDTIGRPNVPDLVLVRAPSVSPAAGAEALHIARRHSGHALLVAVLQLQDDAPDPVAAQLQQLHEAFDAVFVDRSAGDVLARRLVRAITSPGNPDQLIGCDWNDVCTVVRGAGAELPARYGFGRGAGEARAADAVAAAIAQIASQGAGLIGASAVCVAMHASTPLLFGREIKEVMAQIRTRIDPGASVVQSFGHDAGLPTDTLEVDIFAFGQPCMNQGALAGGSSCRESQQAAGTGASLHAGQPFDIPRFMRDA